MPSEQSSFGYVLAPTLVTIFEAHAPDANIKSFGDGFWWAFVTLFTVGYGDKYPVTLEGRGIAVALMIVGLGLSGMVAGTIASFFVQQQSDRQESLQPVLEKLEELEALVKSLLPSSDAE